MDTNTIRFAWPHDTLPSGVDMDGRIICEVDMGKLITLWQKTSQEMIPSPQNKLYQ